MHSVMKLCFLITIIVIFLCMNMKSTHANCAAGQSSTVVPGGACTEPFLIGHGPYGSSQCFLYAGDWAQYCVGDNSCDVCICSCVPANTGCPARPAAGSTTVCTTCPDGHRGDGLTCTLCATGTISTVPVSNTCITAPSSPVCPTTRSLTCSGTCACTPTTSADSGVITDGPGNYVNNMNCQYLFTSNRIVTLQFTSFNTEAGYDFVTINRCTTATCQVNTQLLRVAGTSTSLYVIYSSDAANPFLRLTFTTDTSVVREGWSANWALTGSVPQCGLSCLSGQYLSSTTCTNCPTLTTAPAASTTVTACTCNAGSSGPNGGPCTLCTSGTYKSVTGSSTCLNCPARSDSPPQSTAVTNCICNAGSSGQNGGTCTQCSDGTYKPSTGDSNCLGCPANSISPAESTALSACRCNPGWNGPDGGTCTQCSGGLYKSGVGNTGCVGCPATSLSPAGSTAVIVCVCNTGWNGPNSGPNVQCTGGTYKIRTGNTGCLGCPADSLSPAGSTSIAACVCNAGSDGPNGGPCGQCGAGQYISTWIDDFLQQEKPFIVLDAVDWNVQTQSFDSLCVGTTCGGNTGAWEADTFGQGTVGIGTVIGNGANIAVPYVGGDTASCLQWGARSIPASI